MLRLDICIFVDKTGPLSRIGRSCKCRRRSNEDGKSGDCGGTHADDIDDGVENLEKLEERDVWSRVTKV